MPFRVELVPCLSDNYAYLVRDEASGLCAVIDPSEAAPVETALAARGWTPRFILNTHHLGNTRATDIRIHDTDHILRVRRKGMRQQRSQQLHLQLRQLAPAVGCGHPCSVDAAADDLGTPPERT